VGAAGSSMRLDAGAGAVPFGHLNQGLLDAATHGILHDELSRWSDQIGDDVVGYPHRLDVLFNGPAPAAGEVCCESRFVGFHDNNTRLPAFRIQLTVDGRLFADMRLVEILMPKGPLGMAAPSARRRFLAERRAAPSVGLSRADGEVTVLTPGDVSLSDWFPSTIRAVYGTDDPRQIAVAEHVARRTGAHPSAIQVRGQLAFDAHDPLIAHPVRVEEGELITVRSDGAPRLTVSPVAEFWRAYFDVGPWPVEELYYALVEQFVAGFHVEDPDALRALHGRGVLYLGNHQVGIESLIFSIVASALQGSPTLTLAKKEHRTSWLGELISHCFTWPGVEDPGVITYFDREDPTSLPRIVQELAGRAGRGKGAKSRSLMVHVEGTRAHSARHRVEKMSGVFCDLAISAGIPIVPVRFTGGLPVEPVAEKLEYPTGMGRQDYWLGTPIPPSELEDLGYKERIERVVQAVNALGPSADVPHPPDPELAAAVDARTRRSSVPFGLATLLEVLSAREHGPEVAALLSAVEHGAAIPADDARGRWIAGLASVFTKPRAC
ncbi:MAG TPA: 3-hydroxyacyl-[acyl-carrier-protein] dehydratase FabA, partial [Polyangiaceae bacterium]|nr:3-hydroxyacyl-[acyl-carrier-protein] dehydratase FabA [Polyangiaceae bacterium]